MIFERFTPLYLKIRDMLERFVAPVFDLILRVYVGLVFFRAGLQKTKDWESTVYLFQDEYKIPILPPEWAAALGTSVEITMPLFLFVGLAARLAALPLIALTCVIQFVLGAMNPTYDLPENIYWLLLLGTIVVRGPGRLSLDYLIARRAGVQRI